MLNPEFLKPTFLCCCCPAAATDYVDSEGNLLEDLPLPNGTASKDDRTARSSTGGKAGSSNNFDGDCVFFETQTGNPTNQAYLSGMPASAADLIGGLGSAWGGLNGVGLSGAKVMRSPAVLDTQDVPGVLPEGCSLESVISGSDGYMRGVLYKTEAGQGGCGLWTGYKFYTYGEYQSESDARQMLTRSMDMLSDDRQVRAVAIPAAAAAAAGIGVNGGKADGQLFGQTNMTQSQMVGQTLGQNDAFMAALGLGGLRPAGMIGGGFFAPVSAAAAAVGGDSSRVISTMGNMANYDFAKAQQLVREAVEQQQQQQSVSVGISFPPLTIDLPVGSQAVGQQQQQQGDIHFVLQRYLQQGETKQQQPQQQQPQQQQQQPAAAEPVAQLNVFDVATLHHLIKQQGDLPQQQQQQQPAAVSSKPIGGNISSISVEELLASIGAKKPTPPPTAGVLSSIATTAAPAAASSAPYWSNLLALTNATTQSATTAAVDVSAAVQGSGIAAAEEEEPAAKRLRVSDQGPPAAEGGDGGDPAAEAGLQEAVKQIMALSNGTAS